MPQVVVKKILSEKNLGIGNVSSKKNKN
jgi:hypothetical protein